MAHPHVSGQRSCIDLFQDILRLHSLQVDHRGLDIPVSHPGLEGANVHSMPQVLCGKRVTEFVKEVVLAVRTFRAAVAAW